MTNEELNELTQRYVKTWLHERNAYVFATRCTDEIIEFVLDKQSFTEKMDLLYYALQLRREMKINNYDIGSRLSILHTNEDWLNIAHELSSYANKTYIRGEDYKQKLKECCNVIIKNASAMISLENAWKSVEFKIRKRYSYEQQKAMGIL